MRRGCIAISELKCDGCKQVIEYGNRYLVLENDTGKILHFCISCCLSKGYATKKREKGKEVLTFLSSESNPLSPI